MFGYSTVPSLKQGHCHGRQFAKFAHANKNDSP